MYLMRDIMYCKPGMESLDGMMSMEGVDPETMKEMDAIMKDYHEFVVSGKREIFKIEA